MRKEETENIENFSVLQNDKEAIEKYCATHDNETKNTACPEHSGAAPTIEAPKVSPYGVRFHTIFEAPTVPAILVDTSGVSKTSGSKHVSTVSLCGNDAHVPEFMRSVDLAVRGGDIQIEVLSFSNQFHNHQGTSKSNRGREILLQAVSSPNPQWKRMCQI